VPEDFRFLDGERLIRFGEGSLGEARELLDQRGFAGYALLSTERALAQAPPDLPADAEAILTVAPGPVPDAAAALIEPAGERPLVAFGGGRVVDAAKAVAAVSGAAVAAVPTTLAGSPFTPFHRLPPGAEGCRFVRPSLAVCEPALMCSLEGPALAATAMNSLAHAMESLYAPLANPLAEGAALRATALFVDALPRPEPAAGDLALAAFLAGYAVGSAGLALHHAVSQTIVRVCGTPHAATNAVMLPHSAAFMALRAPAAMGAFAAALGDPDGDPEAAGGRVAKLAARSGHLRLVTLGVGHESIPAVVEGVLEHPGLPATPGGAPGADDLFELVEGAL
jgi:alcohol dehydrogenase class IV